MSLATDAIAGVDAVLGRLERALTGADVEALLACECDLAERMQDLTAVSAIEPDERGRVQEQLLELRTRLDRCRQLGRSIQTLTAAHVDPSYAPVDYGRRHAAGGRPAPSAHALEAQL